MNTTTQRAMIANLSNTFFKTAREVAQAANVSTSVAARSLNVLSEQGYVEQIDGEQIDGKRAKCYRRSLLGSKAL